MFYVADHLSGLNHCGSPFIAAAQSTLAPQSHPIFDILSTGMSRFGRFGFAELGQAEAGHRRPAAIGRDLKGGRILPFEDGQKNGKGRILSVGKTLSLDWREAPPRARLNAEVDRISAGPGIRG